MGARGIPYRSKLPDEYTLHGHSVVCESAIVGGEEGIQSVLRGIACGDNSARKR